MKNSDLLFLIIFVGFIAICIIIEIIKSIIEFVGDLLRFFKYKKILNEIKPRIDLVSNNYFHDYDQYLKNLQDKHESIINNTICVSKFDKINQEADLEVYIERDRASQKKKRMRK